jgi:fructose 1,6-bisphosphatase
MLNQTLTTRTLKQIINLKQSKRDVSDAVVELFKSELQSVIDQLIAEENPCAIYRCQGAADKLKELIQLFETPTVFNGLIKE